MNDVRFALPEANCEKLLYDGVCWMQGSLIYGSDGKRWSLTLFENVREQRFINCPFDRVTHWMEIPK